MRLPSRLMIVLGALAVFGPMTTDLYLPGLPDLARDLGVTTAGAQTTFTATIVGLGLGQVVAGPIGDALGRRRPILVGLVVFTLSSAACALADSLVLVSLCRLVQGLSGAAGIVLGRAMVRDEFDDLEAARMYSSLAAILSIGPIVAPAIGGAIMLVTSWRGIFWFLALFGALLAATAAAWTHETLPPERRRSGELGEIVRSYGALLRDRRFLGYALPGALSSILLFGFISSSAYVYQDHYGFSPQVFGVVFAAGGVVLMTVSIVNRRLIGRVPETTLLTIGCLWIALAGCAVGAATLLGAGAAIVVPLVGIAFSGLGLMFPNSTSLSLRDQGEKAGTASGLTGLVQFAVGAAVALIVGAVDATPEAMGIVMAIGGVVPALVYVTLAARPATPATPR
jgi:DHA1 family bicyclomycin/chloramphenicol resistance-like MFS transporter